MEMDVKIDRKTRNGKLTVVGAKSQAPTIGVIPMGITQRIISQPKIWRPGEQMSIRR